MFKLRNVFQNSVRIFSFSFTRIKQVAMLSNHTSARIQLSVVGNGALMQPSVCVTTDKVNYLFNCGEGTQRMIIEHNRHLKLSKIQNIFFSNTSYENWSGFFGFILTIAEIRTDLNVFGSREFKNIIKLYDRFLYSAGNVKLNLITTDEEPYLIKELINDDDFIIRSISLEKTGTAFVLLAKDKTGKLLIEKCKQLKIPPGPEFARLKNGESVTINGRLIEPNDVLGPPEIGPACVIMECSQSSEQLSTFLAKVGDFQQHIDGKELELVIHMSNKQVVDDSEYQSWLRKFPSKVKHLFLNEKTDFDLGLISSTELQVKLNQIDDELFKLLNEKQFKYPNNSGDNNVILENCPNLLAYNIRPRKGDYQEQNIIEILETNCCEINTTEILNQLQQQPDFHTRLNLYRQQIEQRQQKTSDSDQNEFPNVLFLGTASSCPGKQRNTSAILVNLDQQKSMLLDCGEATFFQMQRFFGREHVHQQVVTKIGAVFISHYHADHHFGLIKLIKERGRIQQQQALDRLLIIAPYSIISFLSLFDSQIEDLSKYYQTIACENLMMSNQDDDSTEKQILMKKMQLENVITVHVPHCFESYGIVLKHQGKTIAYSGDSMYSDAFDNVGKNCDLLIHEATMNDDLLEEARLKRHSTISQAIQVGRKINAQYTLLTHFSQRYAKMAPINLIQDDERLKTYIEDRVGIAFDFMQISLGQLWKVARVKYPLEILFDEEIQRMQNVVAKRNFKRKLLEEVTARQQ